MVRTLCEKFLIALRNPQAIREFILYSKLYSRSMGKSGSVFKPSLMESRLREALLQTLLLKIPLGDKTLLARMANVRVLRGSRVRGVLNLGNPMHVQINKDCRVRNISTEADAHLLIDNGTRVSQLRVERDTLISPRGILEGHRLMRPGVFVTVDLEGSLGLDHGKFRHSIRGFNPRKSTVRLMQLLEKWEIPTTWFSCGHLFLTECHGDHPYSEVDWDGVDWFRYDPASIWQKNSSWYLPDVIEQLVDTDLFEMAYHSFAHMLYIETSDQSIRTDAEFAETVRKEWNIPFDSIGFTCNEPSRIELLLEHGFKRFRGLVGSVPDYGVIQFPHFSFLHATAHLSPKMHVARLETLARLPYVSLFTHAHDWISDPDFDHLESLLKRLAKIQDTGMPFFKVSQIPLGS